MKRTKSLLMSLVMLFPSFAHATWSIAALNQQTHTITVAGASCSYMVYGIAGIIPDKGVVVVQAASNEKARSDALSLMAEDKPLTQILTKIATSDYDEQNQQYALLSFAEVEQSVGYTGESVEGFKGIQTGKGFSVQVNTMQSPQVLSQTFKTFQGSKWQNDSEFAQAVLQSLTAGAAAGGDKRCQGSNSSTAFISVYRATDNPGVPWLNLVIYGLDAGSKSAVKELNNRFTQWLKSEGTNLSTQSFVIPVSHNEDANQ